MAAPITVLSTPLKISSVAAKPYLITNTGKETIYLGQDSNVSPNNYAALLNPGQGLNWQEINTEVWATTGVTGKTSPVIVAYEAAGAFSSQVTANVGNQPELLETITIPFVNGTSSSRSFTTGLDISQYASVIVQVSTSVTVVAGGALYDPPNSWIDFIGIQSSTNISSIQLKSTNNAVWTFASGSATGATGLQPEIKTYQFSVTNQYLTTGTVTVNNFGGASGTVATVTARLYGSYESITKEKYKNYFGANIFLTSNNIIFPMASTSTFAAPQSGTTFLCSTNGDVRVLTASGSGAAGLTQVAYILSYFSYWSGTMELIGRARQTAPATAFDFSNQVFTLPNAPISITQAYTGTGNVTQTLTMI